MQTGKWVCTVVSPIKDGESMLHFLYQLKYFSERIVLVKIQNIIVLGIVILALAGVSSFVYKSIFPSPCKLLFKTQKPERRDIYSLVHAEGSLEAQGTVKIGSLISAKVKKIYVKEGDKVVKGTLLADLINDIGGDTSIRQAQAQLKKTQAIVVYLAANYKREQALFQSGQSAKEAFEKITEEYEIAQADVASAQAAYDRELFLFDQTHVYAPQDGTIIAIPVKEGQAFSPYSSSQTLFEIAKDLGTMSVTLYIDENKMGDVKVGMEAKISVDAYPYKKPWKGKIISLGLGRSVQAANQSQASVAYEAEVLIDNAEGLLRPGMTVHAKIMLSKVKHALSVPGFVFQLNPKVLEGAAKIMGYDFRPIDLLKKKELIRASPEHPIKMLWVKEGKAIVEKSVAIGTTDNAYFQILSGIQETDDIITDDMTASDEIKKIAKQMASN